MVKTQVDWITIKAFYLLLVLLGDEIVVECNRLLLLLNSILTLSTDVRIEDLLWLLRIWRLDQILLLVLHRVILRDVLLFVLLHWRINDVLGLVILNDHFLRLAAGHYDALRWKLLLLLLLHLLLRILLDHSVVGV